MKFYNLHAFLFSTLLASFVHAQECEIPAVKKNLGDELQKSAIRNIQDCKEGMTELDKRIIGETIKKAQVLNVSGSSSAEIEAGVGELVSSVYDSLSPAAKAALTQAVFEQSLASVESVEYRAAFKDYMDAVNEHTKVFGPGGKYSSIGTYSDVVGSAYKKFSLSWDKVQNKFRKLLPAIEKLNLPEEQHLDLTEKLGLFNSDLNYTQNHNMFNASQKRMQAEQGIVLQVGAAAALTVVTAGAGAGAFAAVGAGTSTVLAISGGASVAATIFAVGQGKMAAEALWSKGNFGCEYALRAYEENPKIAKAALISGVTAAVLGPLAGKFATSEKVMAVLKYTKYAGEVVMAGSIILDSKQAYDKYNKGNSLLEQSQQALKANDLVKAAALEKEADEEFELVHKYAVNAGSKVAELITLQILVRKHYDEMARRNNAIRKKSDEVISQAHDLMKEQDSRYSDYAATNVSRDIQIERELEKLKLLAKKNGVDLDLSYQEGTTAKLTDTIKKVLLAAQR